MRSSKRVRARLVAITVPSILLSGFVAAIAIEIWVRSAWNPRKGSPGLFVSDAARGQRLAPNYDGWFAGVPTHINNLGFRDDRDYALEKGLNTFRILVLGDSVTFGHGAIHTYPRLLEDKLRGWRHDVDWQVWNAGVPGYNTSQELAQLLEVGPAFKPDLVVVGFYDNDVTDNQPVAPVSRAAVAGSSVLAWLQRHIYSYEFYKRAGLQLASRLSRSEDYRLRLQHVGTEEALLQHVDRVANLEEQVIGEYDRLSDTDVAQLKCPDGEKPDPAFEQKLHQIPGWEHWLNAVRRLQQLHHEGTYRIVFFLQVVPPVCADGDYFYAGGTGESNRLFTTLMADDRVPAVSTFDAFLHRRPSQMPLARGHTIGNSNMTKAEVLFDYLRTMVLPPLLQAE
ncbi:MAG TPA: GDSL-type esterase/lipase family protein [Vicinamibacterales bacterium]|nr:GDSL-type esterase/lipase family protein [Vicinamibacterales bacterium]